MGYVNIPETTLTGVASVVVGKLLGELSTKIDKVASDIEKKFMEEGCPLLKELEVIRSRKQQVEAALGQIQGRLSTFQRLIRVIQIPLQVLNIIKLIILTLPIPQLYLPVSFTTVYSNILHLIKELIKQISEIVKGITAILKTPISLIQMLRERLSRLDIAIISCEVEGILREKIEQDRINSVLEEENRISGPDVVSTSTPRVYGNKPTELNEEMLRDMGIIDETGTYIFSKIGPLLTRDRNAEAQSKFPKQPDPSKTSSPFSPTPTPLAPPAPSDRTPTLTSPLSLGTLPETIETILNQLENSNIGKETKDRLTAIARALEPTPEESLKIQESSSTHTSPRGDIYTLEVLTDPTSPQIAPRRYAVAKDKQGIIVLKGPLSFSASTDVLLQEIKFRIDNQLP